MDNVFCVQGGHKHHRYNKFYFRQSTFLQSYEPPVFMSDDEDDNTSYTGSSFETDMHCGYFEELDVSVSQSAAFVVFFVRKYRLH